ncbi:MULTISPECIES: hypothetical protein [unclassified Paludibacterium]|uniref:hypothetical protein n=1 Tax=unclassified Paludibacterium TaxID=2618429 RepID=UPI001C04861F|nr:hypothetical protein [Paludibacterium sp. B53371]BEV72912.1 hypothetical protein THUN1379_23940 [Paludibacterium sp. THUN1379]BEV73088.1 hypothetical protein THUN1379_25700 [Paludibacterium sp. THUN1379]
MAAYDGNSPLVYPPSRQQRDLQLLQLVSRLCPPRDSLPEQGLCRLIVDSRLAWAVEAIDGQSSWLYLPSAARARQVAGCTILSLD